MSQATTSPQTHHPLDASNHPGPSDSPPSDASARLWSKLAWALRLLLVPLVYLACFVALTYPAIRNFSTHYYVDGGDGFQNVWNLWWVDKALHEGLNPWFTRYLHHPFGVTLVAHTLNPFNGFAAIPLRALLGPVRALNVIVIFSFVASGCCAFALARRVDRYWAGNLLAGFIFAFCNYHFTHAEGHLQLVSMEWIPLFLLAWDLFVERPTWQRGLAAGGCLFLVILCDYYYFFFCLLAAVILLVSVKRKETLAFFCRANARGLATFATTVAVLIGPLALALIWLSLREKLLGAHSAREFSMDLLSPFIPGGHWRFANLTRWFWARLPGNINESSVHLGLSVCVLSWIGIRRTPKQTWNRWLILTICFGLFALGPSLQIAGKSLWFIPGPYNLLVLMVPPLRISGCPVRMAVMIPLCLGLLASLGLRHLVASGTWQSRASIAALLALMALEYWPSRIPTTIAAQPSFLEPLRTAPRKDMGLMDVEDAFGDTGALYYQTIHELPITYGYISRLPMSTAKADDVLRQLASQKRWQELCERYGIQYFIFREAAHSEGLGPASHWYSEGGLHFYDAGRLWRCAIRPDTVPGAGRPPR